MLLALVLFEKRAGIDSELWEIPGNVTIDRSSFLWSQSPPCFILNRGSATNLLPIRLLLLPFHPSTLPNRSKPWIPVDDSRHVFSRFPTQTTIENSLLPISLLPPLRNCFSLLCNRMETTCLPPLSISILNFPNWSKHLWQTGKGREKVEDHSPLLLFLSLILSHSFILSETHSPYQLWWTVWRRGREGEERQVVIEGRGISLFWSTPIL